MTQPTSRRQFLKAGVATGVGSVVAFGLAATNDADAASAATVQTTEVLVVDTLDDVPAGTRPGTLVVVTA